MNRVKTTLWHALAVLFVTLAACGSGGSDDKKTGASEAGASRTIAVAAASDLKFAMEDIVAAFKSAHPDITVTTTFGSSGNFASQLANRAPFDVFLSADVKFVRDLDAKGLTLKDAEFIYAYGQLVLWAPMSSPIDVEKLGIESVKASTVKKIAIANPEHAPYGRAAVAALKKFGIYDAIADKLVLGDNIAQTAQFVESGAADIGVIALSLAVAPKMKGKGKYWTVPLDSYPRLEQGGSIMSWAKDPEAAKLLRAFMIGPQGREILARYGFVLPGQ